MIPKLEKSTIIGLENLYFAWYPFFSAIKRAFPHVRIAIHGGNVRDFIRCHKPIGDIDMTLMEESLPYFDALKFYFSNTMGFCPVPSVVGIDTFCFGGKKLEIGFQNDFFDFSGNGDFTISSVRFLNDYRLIAHKMFFEDLENRIIRPANTDIKLHRTMKSCVFEEEGYRRTEEVSVCTKEEAIVFDVREIFDGKMEIKTEKNLWVNPDDPSIRYLNVHTYPVGFVEQLYFWHGRKKEPLKKWGVSKEKQDLWHIQVSASFDMERDIDLMEAIDWKGKLINI